MNLDNSQSKINVLEIFTFNKGYMGGVATMVHTYIEAIEQFARYGCKLQHLNINPIFNTKSNKINNFVYIFTQRNEIKRYFKKHQCDVVHIHTSREFLFLKDLLLAKLIKKQFKIPVVLTIHVGDWNTVFYRIGWFKRKAIHILNQYVDTSIFLSERMRKEFVLKGLEIDKSTILYNFHNISYHPIQNKGTLRLLFVGAIHREKGIIELLTAFSKLNDVQLHLSICGKITDDLNDRIKSFTEKCGNRISFLGYVTGDDKISIFNNSDILILPSYHEGLPLVILEALGAGCAIISTRVGAIPEILSDDNAYWINIKSIDDIVEAIRYFAAHPQNLQKMKMHNKELSMHYTLDKHIQQLSLIYNKHGKTKA